MSEPFIAEVRIWALNFAPRGWAFCDGQLLPIAQNTALFALVGTTYGGDGRTTLGLPNLQGRACMHPGTGPGLTTRRLGESGGVETVTLTEAQMPSHTHTANAFPGPANDDDPEGAFLGRAIGAGVYTPPAGLQPMADESLLPAGSGQPHTNLQPYLVLQYCIALTGLFPSRN